MTDIVVPDAILLVDKPEGISSAKAVAEVKHRIACVRKIGHAGTLDPQASGLLICLINRATRLARFAEGGRKEYSGEIRFGETSDTDDAQGEITKVSGTVPEFSTIQESIAQFTGKIEQTPPKVSAVKVNGKRAYKLARQGKEVTLKSRTVRVFRFDISEGAEPGLIRFEIECSKGTYIRSLARDLGEILGCGGLLSALRRVASAPFHVRDAVSLEGLEESALCPWEILFPEAATLDCSKPDLDRLQNGDQRFLLNIRKELNQNLPENLELDSGDSAHVVICREANSGEPVGLFIHEQGDWKFAGNFCNGTGGGVPAELH